MITTQRLRLNPKKCTFGVASGKLLGRIVSERGIEIDPEKIRAILDMPAPRTEKEIRGFLGACHLYLSKKMLEYECKYIMIERLCLALVWATKRLRHYMTEYSVLLVSRLDPLRYLFDRPVLTGRLMRWLVLLIEFDIHYVTQKSVKGSIVVDHLASLPISDDRSVNDDFPDEQIISMTSIMGWRLYFDGAANQSRFGIGILLISPQGDHIPRSVRWRSTGIPIWLYSKLRVFWRTRDEKLKPYHAYLDLLSDGFDVLRYIHLPKAENQFAEALATLASMIVIPTGVTVRPLLIETRSAPAYYCLIGEIEDQIELPWRSPDGLLLLCLDRTSADRVMREVHAGSVAHTWEGVDIIGKISPKSSNGHEYILVAIDYFTKWVEAASYARLTAARVAKFIRSHIICRYGVPHELISDRGVHFRGEVDTLIQEYGIQHHRSSAYRPQTNGAVEAANKNIKRILRKMVETSQDWPRKFQRGDLVLKVLRGLISDPRGKFRPIWSGPYVIRDLIREGAAWLTNLDGNQFTEPINVDQLKKFYV
ncbi:Pol polyprotein [Vitis vinifera]|uniref:Pol polyprotein n=1 Tax=Vitis vinifera TaxID=29760 RepID=A0A438CE24_VITVI|nr:Pol polyprotein [Vitis vinifera]